MKNVYENVNVQHHYKKILEPFISKYHRTTIKKKIIDFHHVINLDHKQLIQKTRLKYNS